MIVKMYMSKEVRVIDPNAGLKEAVQLMRTYHIRRLVVAEGSSVVGIVCHRDLTTAAERVAAGRKLSKILHVMKSPVITVSPEAPIEQAAKLMTKHHIGGLPVVSHGELAGIITESDIFRALSSLLAGHGNSARITFDITGDRDVLSHLVQRTREMDLKLRSFLTFEDDERLLAVARVRGDRISEFIDELWESGQPVVNIIRLT